MSTKGFTGISFPFRFDGRGRVAVSTTDINDFSHIKEGIAQIIGTAINERVFEVEWGSEVRQYNFKNTTDESDLALLDFLIKEAVKKWDNRVEIIEVRTTPDDDITGSYTIVDVDFLVTKYMKEDTASIKIGG